MILALVLTLVTGGQAAPAPDDVRLLRQPTVYGDRFVFAYASDLWSWKRGDDYARRLTAHPGREANPRISPDGRWLAFTATYDGNPDVYAMPIDGGEPRRLTFEPDADIVAGWTPDGRIAYSSTAGSDNGERPMIWTVGLKPGLPRRTPLGETFGVSFSPDGTKVAFHRGRIDQDNWRRYRGGRQGRISIFDTRSGAYTELPSGDENRFSPMWIGDALFFLSDREDGTLNVYRYDLATKAMRRLTHYTDADIKWPATDGKTIVFEQNATLHALDVSTGKVEDLTIRILAENLASRPTLRELGDQVTSLSLSPSGSRAVLSARGEVFSVPAGAGDTSNLTRSSGTRELLPTWSPDGKWIAYAGDRTGEAEIYVQPQDGSPPVQVTHGQGPAITSMQWSHDSGRIAYTTRSGHLRVVTVPAGTVTEVDKSLIDPIASFSWSPDGRWLAYTNYAPNGNTAVFLYDTRTGSKHPVTDGSFRDDAVAFDRNGKYLYLVSARSVEPADAYNELNVGLESLRQSVYAIVLSRSTPNPLSPPAGDEVVDPRKEGESAHKEIDFEGLGDRMVRLTSPRSGIQGILAGNGRVYIQSSDGIEEFSMASRAVKRLVDGPVQAWSISNSGQKLGYLQPGSISIQDLGGGAPPARLNLSDVQAIISPTEEWRQIFWESWRFLRDNFYDPKMRGLDWRAVGERYSRLLPYIHHRNDLTYVIGMMAAELSTSHSYVLEGDPWLSAPPVGIGTLGADYVADSGKIRFARIYRGASFDPATRGPLGEPGVDVRDGDYLLEIDGTPLDETTNPGSLLLDRAGKPVTLTVNDRPSLDGARKVRVRPLGSERSLRYYEWTEQNRRYVEKASGGKIGYMHVTDTHIPGAIGFVRGYYRNADKQGLIVDERFNHGGYDPTFFIERLQRRVNTALRSRHGIDTFYPWQTVSGPKAMLINAAAGSGGDLFPWLFKTEKVGPLIGTRTWGGVVGLAGFYNLIDGGQIAAPEFRWYDPVSGEYILENHGADPDIPVDTRADHVIQGKDPQLDAAIAYLLKELAGSKQPSIKRPGPPDR